MRMIKDVIGYCVRLVMWSCGSGCRGCRVAATGDDSVTPPQRAENPECFICATNEGEVWPSQCKCKDRFMHPECQLRFLKTREHMTCPVCLEEYDNVTFRRVRKLQWYTCNTGTVVVMMAFGLIAVFGCTMNTFLALALKIQKGRSSTALLVSACSLGGIFTLLSGCLIRFVKLQGGVRAVVSACYGDVHDEVQITRPPTKMVVENVTECELAELT